MVFSNVSIWLACCNRKSFRSVSPPPLPSDSVPPSNTSSKMYTFNQNSFPTTTKKKQHRSAKQTPMRNKGMNPFLGSTARPAGSTQSDRFIENSIGTLKKRMLSAPTLGVRKLYQEPKVINGWKDKDKENERSEQEEWYIVKKITPGRRNRIPRDDDDNEPVFYDRNGNRIRHYRNRTPSSLPVSRTNSADDEDFKIL